MIVRVRNRFHELLDENSERKIENCEEYFLLEEFRTGMEIPGWSIIRTLTSLVNRVPLLSLQWVFRLQAHGISLWCRL